CSESAVADTRKRARPNSGICGCPRVPRTRRRPRKTRARGALEPLFVLFFQLVTSRIPTVAYTLPSLFQDAGSATHEPRTDRQSGSRAADPHARDHEGVLHR